MKVKTIVGTSDVIAPPPRTKQTELEASVDEPSTTLPLAPTAPMSLQVQGLLAGVKLATNEELLVRTEASGNA